MRLKIVIMMILSDKKIDIYFKIVSILSGVIYCLPSELLFATYTPSYLGWFLILFLIPILIISFIWLSFVDIKHKKYKNFFLRRSFTIIIIIISLIVKIFIKV